MRFMREFLVLEAPILDTCFVTYSQIWYYSRSKKLGSCQAELGLRLIFLSALSLL